jgi:anti-anti-sigma regulatory factor
MLRITNAETARGPVWTLSGQLAGPFVSELRSSWKQAPPQSRGRRCVVDLSEVTFIDESGEILLREMCGEGVEFIATGVDMKDVVEHLATKGRQPLRPFMAYLEKGCSTSSDV